MLESYLQALAQPRVLVVGAGNIGFKLALRLAETGCHVGLFRRDHAKAEVLARAAEAVLHPSARCAARAPCWDIVEFSRHAHAIISPGHVTRTPYILRSARPGACAAAAGQERSESGLRQGR